LVTGAAGFIGSHLCEALIASGHDVVGLDGFAPFYSADVKRRNLAGLRDHPRFELVEADLLEVSLDRLLEGVEMVAHLAGQPGVTTSWGTDFGQYVVDNVLATQRLLDAATRASLRRLVYASSSSVYGRVTVEAAQLGLRPASPYGVTKLAAEQLVDTYAHSHGVPAVSLRYFSVYGPRQRPDMAVHRFIESLLDGRSLQIYGDGGQARDFTFVADVVDATVRALHQDLPPGLVLEIAGGRPVAVSRLVRELQALTLGATAQVEHHAERAGDVPRTEGRPDRARQHLGWAASTDLRSGLAQQLAWHRSLRGATDHGTRALVVPGTALSG
jgi:nucleoside-diphosphate-sugar epimerase